MRDEVDCAGDGHGGEEREAQRHVANLADDVKRKEALHVIVRNSTQDTGHHRGHREPQNDRMRVADVRGEDQREYADERVDADFRQQPREEGGDRRRRRVVRSGKPEEQREHRRLDPERRQEQHPDRCHIAIGACRRYLHRKVRHVQRPGGGIEQANPAQEQHRRHKVQGDVLEGALNLWAPAAEGHDHERGD